MKITLLAGPPGSGKSTLARKMAAETGAIYINQDSQQGGHMNIFFDAVLNGKDIIVDRMNFNKQQRAKYLEYAKYKQPSYKSEIIVLHENYKTCIDRVRARFGNHETINEEKSARAALQTFFTKYERPLEGEADVLDFRYPPGLKEKVIVCDLDGTLCDCEHRRHHVRKPTGEKKNWAAFFADIPKDPVIRPVADIINEFMPKYKIIFCSCRDDNQRKITVEWLIEKLGIYERDDYELYMRDRHDSRQDSIVKENILDFELLTRYSPYFMLDDRDQVVKMWRRRGFMCLQVAEGDF